MVINHRFSCWAQQSTCLLNLQLMMGINPVPKTVFFFEYEKMDNVQKPCNFKEQTQVLWDVTLLPLVNTSLCFEKTKVSLTSATMIFCNVRKYSPTKQRVPEYLNRQQCCCQNVILQLRLLFHCQNPPKMTKFLSTDCSGKTMCEFDTAIETVASTIKCVLKKGGGGICSGNTHGSLRQKQENGIKIILGKQTVST